MALDYKKTELEPTSQEMRIEEASLDSLSDDEVNALVADFISESSDNLESIGNVDIVGEVYSRVNRVQALFGQEFDHAVSSIKELIKQGKILIARINGKSVAMIGYFNVLKLPDGRDLYTIMKAATLKEYRGRGIYRDLAENVFEKIRKISPTSPIYRVTKSEKVKEFLRKDPRWKEVQLDDESTEVTKLLKNRKTFEYIEEEMKQGYVRFIFDPQG